MVSDAREGNTIQCFIIIIFFLILDFKNKKNSNKRFSFADDFQWVGTARIQNSRCAHVAIECGRLIFIIGGYSTPENSTADLSAVQNNQTNGTRYESFGELAETNMKEVEEYSCSSVCAIDVGMQYVITFRVKFFS